MLALRRIENSAGKLHAYGASQDSLDCLARTVPPQLHTIGKLLRWGGVPLYDVFAALLHKLERMYRSSPVNAAVGLSGIQYCSYDEVSHNVLDTLE